MNRMVRHKLALMAAFFLIAVLATRAQEEKKFTLREAVTLALQNSRDLKVARVQYTIAQNETGVDRSAFLPNLYTGFDPAYTYGFPGALNGVPPAVFQLNYLESIFNPALKSQQHADEDRAKSQRVELDRIHDDIIVRAATTYLGLAEVRHALDLMRSEQASAEKILQVTRDRVAANQELPIEETRAELTAARIQERIVKLEDRNDSLGQQLRDMTGIPDTQEIQVETEEPAFSTDMQDTAILDFASENDPGIKEAENERAARQQVLRGARLSYFPTLDFVGQYSVLSKFNNYDQFYKTFQRNNAAVGVQITIPLFSSRTRANVALAKSQLDEAELNLSLKRQGVRADVKQKMRNVRELDATREVARLDMKLAQQSLDLLQAKFDQGQATLRDIEEARLEESDKWVAFLDADFARQQAQLVLLQATGQLAKVFQ